MSSGLKMTPFICNFTHMISSVFAILHLKHASINLVRKGNFGVKVGEHPWREKNLVRN